MNLTAVSELSASPAPEQPTDSTPVYLLFALFALAILTLHTWHFHGRPYRQDEAWIVHGALEQYGADAMTQWVSGNIHPPLWMMTANVWVDLFGQHESITRFLSTLTTLFSLALIYRLAIDLSASRSVAFGALFIVGTSSFFQFYTHEFRPYPMLTACVVGMMLAFMRWLRRPDLRHALIFVGSGIAALYVHFFAVYALAALFIFYMLFVRWNGWRFLRALGLFAAIALAYLGWLLPFLHAVLVTNPSGIDYAMDSTPVALMTLYRSIGFRPEMIVTFLFITALLVSLRRKPLLPLRHLFRFDPLWRKGYPLVVALLILLLAFGVNLIIPNLTQRSLVILVPAAALFLAFGFAALPRAAQIAIIVLMLPSAFTFVEYAYPGPQAAVAAYIAPDYIEGSSIILNVPYVPRHVAVLYYVQNRMNTPIDHDLIWQVISLNQAYVDFLPYAPPHLMTDRSAETLAHLRMFIENAERIWMIERAGGNFYSDAIRGVLNEQYAIYRQRTWEREYTVIEYRRQSTLP